MFPLHTQFLDTTLNNMCPQHSHTLASVSFKKKRKPILDWYNIIGLQSISQMKQLLLSLDFVDTDIGLPTVAIQLMCGLGYYFYKNSQSYKFSTKCILFCGLQHVLQKGCWSKNTVLELNINKIYILTFSVWNKKYISRLLVKRYVQQVSPLTFYWQHFLTHCSSTTRHTYSCSLGMVCGPLPQTCDFKISRTWCLMVTLC